MRREPTSRLIAATLGRSRGPLEPPPALLFALELPRALVEFGAFCAAAPALQLAPRGDGHAVLVFPGFTATDSSTAALRTYLRTLGYDAAGWGLGRNLGPTREALQEMDGLVTRLTERHGGAVSIVGCSLGGVYARELAHRRPRDVRLVVTLGSPYQLASPRQSRTSALYDRYTHLHVPADELPRAGRPARPLPVPATSIFTRTDGVVAPATCTEPPTERAETTRCREATVAWDTTQRPCMRSPTGWRSRRGHGRRSCRRGCSGASTRSPPTTAPAASLPARPRPPRPRGLAGPAPAASRFVLPRDDIKRELAPPPCVPCPRVATQDASRPPRRRNRCRPRRNRCRPTTCPAPTCTGPSTSGGRVARPGDAGWRGRGRVRGRRQGRGTTPADRALPASAVRGLTCSRPRRASPTGAGSSCGCCFSEAHGARREGTASAISDRTGACARRTMEVMAPTSRPGARFPTPYGALASTVPASAPPGRGGVRCPGRRRPRPPDGWRC